MNNIYRQIYTGFTKSAIASLTPEAMQAAQAPMPPQGGAPMDPAAMGGMPADPAMMGGAPAGAPPMDPAMAGGAGVPVGPAGGTVPPEILQDQQFLAFLQQVLGINFDPQSQMFVGPQGEPIPADAIIQAYQEFQTQVAAQAQGAMPQGGAPMEDPAAMAGAMPPEAAAGMPMDPAAMGGMPPEAETGGMPPEAGMPMDPAAMGGMPAEGMPAEGMPADPMQQMAEMVLSAVETIVNEALSAQEKKISTLLDKVDTLKKDIESILNSDNKRTEKDEDEDSKLRGELEQELAAQSTAAPAATPTALADTLPKAASQKKSAFSLVEFITGRK